MKALLTVATLALTLNVLATAPAAPAAAAPAAATASAPKDCSKMTGAAKTECEKAAAVKK